MAEKLGELLIRKNLLTQAQLEEALQAQVIFGGKLGTVLIEMGLITEDALADILAQLISIPCAKPGQLQNIPEDVIKIISAELAEKHKVMPVSVSGKKLTLAMAEPHKLQAIDEISSYDRSWLSKFAWCLPWKITTASSAPCDISLRRNRFAKS
ncbi:MAG: hypothetical protein EP304_05830 [Deltaproteobacteria bacterium]|nr:MAG: hypothetical protein EP304_05830 [Deltaproteobacteria bacterium]